MTVEERSEDDSVASSITIAVVDVFLLLLPYLEEDDCIDVIIYICDGAGRKDKEEETLSFAGSQQRLRWAIITQRGMAALALFIASRLLHLVVSSRALFSRGTIQKRHRPLALQSTRNCAGTVRDANRACQSEVTGHRFHDYGRS